VGDIRSYRRFDLKNRQREERSAIEIAQEYEQRYSRADYTMDARAPGLQDAELVKRMLMPSVEGPKLWSVACKAGKEFEILRVIFNRQLSSARQSANSTIYSAFARGDLKGYIYVEAMNPALVQRALNGVQGVYLTKMNLIPVQEMTYTLNVKEQKLNVRPNDWVRMKRGKYAGDLAQVIRLHESGETVVVRLIPRLGLEDQEEEEGQAKEIKGTKRKQKTRPAQRLFDPDYVRKMDPTKTVLPRPNGYYQIGPDLYKGGFLEKEVRIAYLATEGVNPTLDEISAFANTADNNDEDHMNLAELVAPLLAAKKDRVVDYSLGDHVEVIEGGLKHATGIVRTINDDTALVDILTASSMATGTELPVSSLRKLFHTGDHVRVIHGIYQDETGSVVKVKRKSVCLAKT
jgi:transcription elongation factor SPT5